MKKILNYLKLNENVLILGLMGFVIPFYIRGIVIDQSDIEIEVYNIFTSPFNVDIFSASKARLLMVFILLATIQFLYMFLKNKIDLRTDFSFAFLGVFLIAVFLSSFLSEYKQITFLGFSDRYEGAYVYFYYILIIFFSYWYIKSESNIKFIYWFILFSVIPIFIIGFLQANDIFPIFSERIKPFMFGLNEDYYQGTIEQFISRGGGSYNIGFDKVSATLFNPNYVGVYSVSLFFVSQVLILKEKSKIKNTVLLLLGALSFALLLLSGSKTGFFLLGFIYILYIALNLFNKQSKAIKLYIIQFILMICVFIFFNIFSEGEIGSMLLSIETEDIKVIDNDISINTNFIEKIDVENEYTTISDGEYSVKVKAVNEIPEIINMEVVKDNDNWDFEYMDNILLLKHNGNNIYLKVNRENKVGVINFKNEVVTEVRNPEELILNGKLFSTRGYIWSKALTLIKERPIIGYGADTFAIYEEDDLINKINFKHNTTSMSINPHNLYLTIIYNFGFLGFISWFGFILSIYVRAIYIYIKEIDIRNNILFVLTPLTAFLSMSFLNDTIVGTGVVLYLLIGLSAVMVSKKFRDM